MSRYLARIISELLFYRPSRFAETRRFAVWKHNRHLCPWLEFQLNEIRGCVLKHQAVAYDIQGVHDLGTDVVLRYQDPDGTDPEQLRFLAFQVKSNDDLMAREYLRDLRSQVIQAMGEYRESLEQYYVMICGDIGVHHDKVREIKKSLANIERVIVVDPAYALTFLRLSRVKIGSMVDLFFKEEDDVLKQAQATVEGMRPTQAGVLVAAIAHEVFDEMGRGVVLEEVFSEPFVQTLYGAIPDFHDSQYREWEERLEEARYGANEAGDAGGPLTATVDGEPVDPDLVERGKARRDRNAYERFAEDTDVLVGTVFSERGSSGRVRINPEHGRAIQAVLLDANVRYGYAGEELMRFVYGMLDVLGRYGLHLPGEEDELPQGD